MKIIVLGGGLSTERAVSLVSASCVCKALREMGHKAVFVDTFLGLENYEGSLESIFDTLDGLCEDVSIQETVPDLEQIRQSRKDKSASRLGKHVLDVCKLADCVYLCLHGADGEDGKLQAALELLGIPYTGSGPLGSAMAMDKAVAKIMMKSAGVQTPNWTEYRITQENLEALCKQIQAPCVIKASNGGSSIGVYIAKTQEEVVNALTEVVRYDPKIIVEDLIVGREFTVPVFGSDALSPIEIVIPESSAFDYTTKYQAYGGVREICPAPIDADLEKRLQNAALQVHNALGLAVVSRSDYIVDAQGEIWCLEVNTLPGMTTSSLLPKAANHAGYSYGAFCEAVVNRSMNIRR